MNINGISSNSTIDALTALSNKPNTDGTDAAQGISTPAASTSVSKPGEFMAKLSQLLQQDPAKFKQVAQQISDQLQAAAQNASGPQAQFLSKLSDNFAQASSSGSLTSLQPPAGGGDHATVGGRHHHGGGHHGGGSGGIESVLSNALDEINQALSSSATTGSPSNVATSSIAAS